MHTYMGIMHLSQYAFFLHMESARLSFYTGAPTLCGLI